MTQLSDVPVVLVHLSACNIVSSLCFSFSDCLDADVQDSLQNPDTDHEGHLAFHIRKSYSSPAACDKCIQTDVQIDCKSATVFKNVDTDKDWPVQHVEIHVGDSASVRVWEEKLYFWHNFKLQMFILFQTLEEARSSLFVMFRILCSVDSKYLKVEHYPKLCAKFSALDPLRLVMLMSIAQAPFPSPIAYVRVLKDFL
jgi:hypothetical protein